MRHGETSHIEPRRWHLQVSKTNIKGPPYPLKMAVTPHSLYGDDIWLEPLENLPAGSKNRSKYEFFAPCKTTTFGMQSLKPTDTLLLTQFKDAMIGVKYHRHILKDNPVHNKVPKPRTWHTH